MKKFCKIKIEGNKGTIQKCVKAETKKQAEIKLKEVKGNLIEVD